MEHKDLVQKVSRVHEELRKKRRENELNQENWDTAWKDHTQNEQVLQEYAESMHRLATEVWDGRNASSAGNIEGASHKLGKIKCRLEWVHQRSIDYFRGSVKSPCRKLDMLDVGSCYNPFRKYGEHYDITPIDLCPAPGCEHVLKCDFLQLKVGDRRIEEKDSKTLVQLKQESFDIVVFSFFLEYLPDRKQRLESCRKGRDLLRTGGILFILRPDSNRDSPTSINTKLIKGLKVGNAMIGLKRIYLEKLEHLWCMGFVKMTSEETTAYVESPRFIRDVKKLEVALGQDVMTHRLETLFGIPQDLRISYAASEEGTSIVSQRAEPELFNELPDFFIGI